MNPDNIAERFPRLYHMAEEGSWESIRRHGLLSTEALLDLFEVTGARRGEILHQRRAASVPLEHALHGTAVVRDQKPLSRKRLEACLTDMTFEEWLATLNSRVFFWLTEHNLEVLLGARAYRDQPHDVITVDTAALVAAHADRITLSPINSGATLYKPPVRGRQTFLPIADYPFDERRRAGKTLIVELAVERGVPDIEELALGVDRRQSGQPPTPIWSPR